MQLKQLRLPYFRHRFVIRGLNLERFLNTIQKENISLISAARTNQHSLTCVCDSCDLHQIKGITEDKGWYMEQVCPLGLSALVSWMRRRPGIPAGLAVSLVLVIVMTRFVWYVDIQNAGAYQADILMYLNENGFRPGIRRSDVDADMLEKRLMYRYPEVAWFHVRVSGMTLVVDTIHGSVEPEAEPELPRDVIALQSGIIQSLRVYAGTPAVKTGDIVSKGEVLIRGEERTADGETIAVHAQGVVMARCWRSAVVKLPVYDVNSTETGRQTETLMIRTPFGCWPTEWSNPSYLSYNTYIEEFPAGGAFFPIVFQRIIQREVSMEYVRRNLEEVKKEAEEAAWQQLKTMVNSNEIIDKWADYCMIEDDTLAVSVTAERLVDIGGDALP